MKEKIYWNHNWNNKKTRIKDALKSMLLWAMICVGIGIFIILIEKLGPIFVRFIIQLFAHIIKFANYLNGINSNLGMIVFLFIVGSGIGLYIWRSDDDTEDDINV